MELGLKIPVESFPSRSAEFFFFIKFSLLYHLSFLTGVFHSGFWDKLSQNAKNLQYLLKFGLIEDNVTVFQ